MVCRTHYYCATTTSAIALVVKDDVILHHRACAYLNKLTAAIHFESLAQVVCVGSPVLSVSELRS